MKNITALLSLLVMMAMVSCCERTDASDALRQDNAALALYYKYANDTNLTVAFIGDYVLDGNQIDALMLRAVFDDDWNRLKSEFGMFPELSGMCGDTKVVSVGIDLDADFIEELGLDTITELSQVDEERIDKMTAIIVENIRGIVTEGPMRLNYEADFNMDEHVIAIAEEIGRDIIHELLVSRGAIPDEQGVASDGLVFPDSTIKSVRDNGHKGYISAADDSSRTLWLFFYDDEEECKHILTHIREDILVEQ